MREQVHRPDCSGVHSAQVLVHNDQIFDQNAVMSHVQALVNEGKVKYIGLSEVGPEDLRKAHKVHTVTAVQLEWSLFTRDVEVSHS